MHLPSMKMIASMIASAWILLQLWWAKIAPIIEPVVKQLEQDCLDGKITKVQRKQLAMATLVSMQEKGIIKLSVLQKLFASYIINIIAERLPDFEATQAVKDVIAQLPK